MRVLVLVKATEASETGAMPAAWRAEMMAAMGRFNDELRAAGVFVMAEGLAPTAQAWRVAFDGRARKESAGPFGPAGEQVAGFWLWEVRDMEEARAWVRRCPSPMPGPSVIEVRPVNARPAQGDKESGFSAKIP